MNYSSFQALFMKMKEQCKKELKALRGQASELANIENTDERERDIQLNWKVMARKFHYMKKIDHALVKIREGSFGECEDCDQQISEERLKARPMANFCITCQEDVERKEGHVLYNKRSMTGPKGQAYMDSIEPVSYQGPIGRNLKEVALINEA